MNKVYKHVFHLVDNKCYHVIFECETLIEMRKHIKNFINEPRDYLIDEFNNGNFIDSMAAYYLIENYKTEESLPETFFVDEIKNASIAFKTWCDENTCADLTNDQLYDEYIKYLNK